MKRLATRRRNEPDTQIDLTPLIDVVFIMLIFFICTSSFVKESGVVIQRPTASSGTNKSNPDTILLGIDANSQLWLNGKVIEQNALRMQLEQSDVSTTKQNVVIQADKSVSTGTLITIMDEIRLAGINDIAVSTKRGAS